MFIQTLLSYTHTHTHFSLLPCALSNGYVAITEKEIIQFKGQFNRLPASRRRRRRKERETEFPCASVCCIKKRRKKVISVENFVPLVDLDNTHSLKKKNLFLVSVDSQICFTPYKL